MWSSDRLHPGPMPATAHILREEVREFLSAQSFTRRSDPLTGGFDADLSRALGKRGWVGATVPAQYGGSGMSQVQRYVIAEELLAAGAPVVGHWTADRQIAPSLLAFGSTYLKDRFLPGIVAGETYFAIGLSEPDAGSDLAAVRSKARQVDGGWRLTGTKVWTSMAMHAHVICVLARTGGGQGSGRHDGMSQLLVEMDAPGVEVRPIVGFADSEPHFAEVVFDDVFVADDMILGSVGDGWRQATHELAYERSGPDRILSTIALIGQARPSERGRLLARLWALRQASISVNQAIASGTTAPDVEAVMVKDLGTQFENDVLDAALSAASEMISTDHPDQAIRLLAEGLLSSPIFTIRGGTTQILRGIVARSLGVR